MGISNRPVIGILRYLQVSRNRGQPKPNTITQYTILKRIEMTWGITIMAIPVADVESNLSPKMKSDKGTKPVIYDTALGTIFHNLSANSNMINRIINNKPR
jgi:hypothetical protein